MPHFLDVEKDAKLLKVGDDGRFGFTDQLYYGRVEVLYRAIVKGHEGWTYGKMKNPNICWDLEQS